MTSRYVVIQYLPDPLTDERINIGVAACDGNGMHARFLSEWKRVQSFGGQDIGFLRSFAREVLAAADTQDSLLPDPAESMKSLLFEVGPDKWINSIQFTKPRASTKPANELADDVAKRFLKARVSRARARDRRWVRAHGYRSVMAALETAGVEQPEDLVRKQQPVQGKIESHVFDLVAGNGKAVTAALALSFEGQTPAALQREYSSAAWALEDVRSGAADLPLAVLVLPPKSGKSKIYDQAVHVFDALEARAVIDDDVPVWADEVAEQVSEAVAV